MRFRALIGAAVAAVLVLAVLPSVATPPRAVLLDSGGSGPCSPRSLDSVDGHLYKYCGQHWPLNRLPVVLHVNVSNRPAGIGQGPYTDAARTAALTWDLISPIQGTGARPSGCANTKVICIGSVSAAGSRNPNDGINTVSWVSWGLLGLPGVAWVTPSSGVMTDVDIELNRDVPWFAGAGGDAATGLPIGALGGICPHPAACPYKFDLQGILTHELGHALGLEDLNPGATCDNPEACGWPGDPADASDYTQVMYKFYYPGSSTKRVLGAGDIAGLYRVLFDSVAG